MTNLIKSEDHTPPIAVILSVTQEKHWSEYTDQTITHTLINGRFEADFSSVLSHGNYPYLDETCVFIRDTQSNGTNSEVVDTLFSYVSSEVIGPAGMDIHDFLESAGYTVTYGLDSSEESGSLES